MSFSVTNWAAGLELPPVPKNVLLALADFSSATGECWPSVTRLSQRTGFCVRSVQRGLRTLEEVGLLNTSVPLGRGKSSRYRIQVGAPIRRPVTLSETVEPTTESPVEGDIESDKGCQGSAKGDCPADEPLRTINEPPMNHQQAREGARECVGDVQKTFEDFWEKYPRKVGRHSAFGAWKKIHASGDDDVVLAALASFPFDLSRPEFIPYPAKWLSQRRWLDDYSAAAPRPADPAEMSAEEAGPFRLYAWMPTVPGAEFDPTERSTRQWSYRGHYLYLLAMEVAEAARLPDGWRGDWSKMLPWLTEDVPMWDKTGSRAGVISGAIKRMAIQPGYRPPRSLAYFDQAVRALAASWEVP